MMVYFHIFRIAQVLYAEKLFAFSYTVIGKGDFFIFFIYSKIFFYPEPLNA